MTLHILFAGLGILIYVGVGLAETAVAGFSRAHKPDSTGRRTSPPWSLRQSGSGSGVGKKASP